MQKRMHNKEITLKEAIHKTDYGQSYKVWIDSCSPILYIYGSLSSTGSKLSKPYEFVAASSVFELETTKRFNKKSHRAEKNQFSIKKNGSIQNASKISEI